MVVVYEEILDFAGGDGLQQIDDLLVHFFVVHDEEVLAAALDGSPSNHIKTDAISNANGMSSGDVTVFHLGNDLDDLVGVGHLSVCQKDNVANVVLHFFFNVDDVQEGIHYLSPSEICLKVLDLGNRLFEVLVGVGNAGLEHAFEI